MTMVEYPISIPLSMITGVVRYIDIVVIKRAPRIPPEIRP
jgi:hypothetical protein